MRTVRGGRFARLLALVGVVAVLGGLVAVVETTQADAAPVHGLGFFKGCASPTDVLSKTRCNFTINNSFDPDTLQLTSIVDIVKGAAGDDNSGNILPVLTWSFTGGASCNATQTVCTLPPGSRMSTDPAAIGNPGPAQPFVFHTVTGADANNANPLQDSAQLTWIDMCTSGAPNCPVGSQLATTGSQTSIRKLPSTTDTLIHNAQHNVVTAVEAGATVHDFVTVSGPAGQPAPTGKVNVDWFTNGECTGTPAANSGDVNLVNGSADVTGFPQKPAAGQYGFLAHYSGSSVYQPSDGICEPLIVVDASIAIAPNATNEVNDDHTFTVTVMRNDGTGFTPAAGTPITYTLTDQNGAVHTTSPNPPTTCDGATDGNGQCDIVFTSSSGGKVVGNASVTLTLAGVTFTRDTDPATATVSGPGGSGPATKTFVDANITIAPNATNEVGQNHTFQVTVKQNIGGPNGFVNVPDGTKPTVTLTNSNGAAFNLISNTCLSAGTVNGRCTVTFTSPSAGKVTGNASVNLTLNGVSISRDTNPNTPATSGPGGSGPAVKTFVDANIRITPPNPTNEVGQPHTFTVTVKRDNGNGAGLVAVPNGTKPVVTLVNSNGAAFDISNNTCESTGTTNGQCTVTFTSPSAGQVTGNASVTLTVGGVTLTRDTDPNTPATSGPNGSGPAVKTFVDANITITPNATNEVGQPHTFTVTVKQNAGKGAGFVNVPNGTKPVVTLTNSNGAAFDVSNNTCVSTGTTNGKCTITFSSPSAGKVTGNATVTLTVGGVSLTRDTDPATASVGAGPGGSGPAVKTFVDANIAISPSATNEVGDPHTFTVTVKQNAGAGAGFVNVPNGTKPVVTLVNSNGAAFNITNNTCASTGTTAGQCAVTFSSPSAGVVTGNASVTLTVGGVSLTRDTNPNTPASSGPGGSGPAVKTFVDASIAIGPDGTNLVTDPHTFTVTVKQNLGDNGGFVSVPDGTKPVVSLTDAGGAASQVITNTCTNPGTVAGQCAVTFTSPTTGTTTGNASVSLMVGGVLLVRDTNPATPAVSGPGGSGPALKTWIDIPTVASTAQFAYPNDSATVTSQAAGDDLPAGGTVTFRLYQAGGGQSAAQNCAAAGDTVGSGGLIYKQVNSSVGGAHQVTTSTSNTSVSVNTNGSYFWLVIYDPGDSAHTGRSSQCVENTQFTFTNDPGPGTVPS